MAKPFPPLSATEMADTERHALRTLREDAPNAKPWAMSFVRLLSLHRAIERQSTLLQEQVRALEKENERLAADNAHLREEKRLVWEKTNAPLGTCHDVAL